MRFFATGHALLSGLRAWRGCILLALLLGAAALLLRWLAPESEAVARWMEAVMPEGPAGLFWYVGVSAVASCLAAPRQVLSFAGGFAFGPFCGALLATLGVTLGCALAFGGARLLGRNALERRYGDKTAALNRHVVRHPFALAVLIRFFPSGNNLFFSLLAGASRIPARPFILGSCLGYVPQNLLFAMLGSGVHVDAGWRIGLAAVLLAVSCLLAWRLYAHCFSDVPLERFFLKRKEI